jgi:hypothetical protein
VVYESEGRKGFVGEEVAGRAPKDGGAATHVLAPLPLSFCGIILASFLSKGKEWLVGLAGGKDEWR